MRFYFLLLSIFLDKFKSSNAKMVSVEFIGQHLVNESVEYDPTDEVKDG